jgi:hypothetical protein
MRGQFCRYEANVSPRDNIDCAGRLGAIELAGSPADFKKLVAEEVEKWGKVIIAANVKPE